MWDDFDVDINLQLCIGWVMVVALFPYLLLVHNGPIFLGICNGKQVNLGALRVELQALHTWFGGRKGMKNLPPKKIKGR
jgi:hypothetical protein